MLDNDMEPMLKPKSNLVVAFLAGVAFASLLAITLRNAGKARLMGDVILPAQVMIGDVLRTSREGKKELADKKLAVLEQMLMDFRNKGTALEISVSKVTELK
jgi:hypothetical protein